jgi:hypothetical protein
MPVMALPDRIGNALHEDALLGENQQIHHGWW